MQFPGFLLRHSVTVEPYLGTGAYGPQYAPARTVKCFRDDKRRLVRVQSGDEIVSETTLYMRVSESIPLESRITVPGMLGTFTAIQVKKADGGGLPVWDHLEINLK